MDKQKRSVVISPLLWEIAIMAIVLILGLLLLYPVGSRAAETEASAGRQRTLTLALTELAEQIKADPTALGPLENGLYKASVSRGFVTVEIQIEERTGAAGSLYTIALSGSCPQGERLSLTTAVYRPGEVLP